MKELLSWEPARLAIACFALVPGSMAVLFILLACIWYFGFWKGLAVIVGVLFLSGCLAVGLWAISVISAKT